ncbi:biofilm-dependent modulation protein, partial [Staphylococcus warneri]
AQPELVNAIAQGLQAEHGVVTEDDILMELTRWVEATDNDILSDIYQQTINYVVSGQNAPL